MKDSPIDFTLPGSEEQIKLTKEQRAELKRKVSEYGTAFVLVEQMIKDGTSTTQDASVICAYLENTTLDVHKLLNYESSLAEEKEKRYVEIRALNTENRELRKQLGGKVNNDDVRERMKLINDSLYEWWGENGCGYVRDIHLSKYCLTADFSFSISGFGKNKDEVCKMLLDKGVIIEEEKVTDCDHNRQWFSNYIRENFPSARVHKFESYPKELYTAHVVFPDLNDFDPIMKTKKQVK